MLDRSADTPSKRADIIGRRDDTSAGRGDSLAQRGDKGRPVCDSDTTDRDIRARLCDSHGSGGDMALSGTRPLHFEARDVLGLSKRETAKLLGVSGRTIQRWDSRDSSTYTLYYADFAKAVFSKDPGLALRLAQAAGTTLAALGLEVASPPAPPAPPPPPVGPPLDYVVDSLVCVAAAAMDTKPQALRPALAAAFTFARQFGLSVEAVEQALVGEPPKAAKTKKQA